MKSVLAVVVFFALAGCAHEHEAHHRGAAPGPARVVDAPTVASSEEARQTRLLLDEPALKVAAIVLRKGTVLPTHHSPAAVTIQALEGRGAVVLGEQRLTLAPGQLVFVPPGAPHSVEPEPGSSLSLLVTHAGQVPEAHP